MSIAAEVGTQLLMRGLNRKINAREADQLLSCLNITQGTPEEQLAIYKQIASQNMAMNIMHQRFKMHFGEDFRFSPPLFLWLSTLADRPGNAILLCAAVALAVEDKTPLTLDDFIPKYMADGVPSAEAFQRAWDFQKITPEWRARLGVETGPDNVLDYELAWT